MDFDKINNQLNRKERELFRHRESAYTRRCLCDDLRTKFREACESICQDAGKAFLGECVTVAEICPNSHQLIRQRSDHELCEAAHYLYRQASHGDSQSVSKSCKSLSTLSEPNKEWLIDELKMIGFELFKDFGIVEKKLIENPELVEKHRRKINKARMFTMAELRDFTDMTAETIRKYFPVGLKSPGRGKSRSWSCSYEQAMATLENIVDRSKIQTDKQKAHESLLLHFAKPECDKSKPELRL